jgi:hypothetical protein
MGALLESGKVGNIGLKQLKEARQEVIRRWDELGLLEGLQGYAKENIAQLFENQASWMLNEATSLGSEGSFETVVFPIVRRVFSKLLANEIVSTQSLNLPIGKLFYFIPKVSRSKFNYDSAETGMDHPDASTTFMNGEEHPTNLYDAFYGEDGLYDKSKGAATTATFSAAANVMEFVPTGVGFAATTGSTIANGESAIIKLKVPVSGIAISGYYPTAAFDDAEEFLSTLTVKSAAVSGKVLDFHFPAQKYGLQLMQIEGTDATVHVVVENNTGSSLTVGNIVATAKKYGTLELEDEMAEVSFELKNVTVSVIERKMRAQWSPELAQDVQAFHNIDAEAELTSLLSEQIAAEIDREILRDLRRGAAWRLTWDYAGVTGRGIDTQTQGAFYTQKDWNQTLITAINQVSAQIHKATLRGGANWIVTSAEISAIFDDLEYFHVSNAAPEQDKYNMGIERVGSLSGRYQVYRDPYFPADTILLGHKGSSLLDTGYIYAPYVPMQLTPTMYNPFTFAPVKGIMTRYAKKMVNNRFYGVIKVKNIVKFDLAALR